MKEIIESKIEEWKKGVDQLQAHRAKLAQQLTEVDTAIQRNIGAIAGAQELLELEGQPVQLELPADA